VITSRFPGQRHQTKQSVLSQPPMGCSIRYACGQGHGSQWLVLLQVRLKQTEPIKRQLPRIARQSSQLVHTKSMPNSAEDFMPNNSESDTIPSTAAT
jgi:hypothetical protein